MSNIAIVYHSGYGHTRAVAEAVAKGVHWRYSGAHPGERSRRAGGRTRRRRRHHLRQPDLHGGVSAEFARFKDRTSKQWTDGKWRNKLAAGFTVSASQNGDKHSTLHQFVTLAMQHGMVWVGLGLPSGNNHSKGSIDDLNRLGGFLGALAQGNADQGAEGIPASDFRTAEALGKRVAEAALRWREQPLAKAA